MASRWRAREKKIACFHWRRRPTVSRGRRSLRRELLRGWRERCQLFPRAHICASNAKNLPSSQKCQVGCQIVGGYFFSICQKKEGCQIEMPYSWRCSPSLESRVHATDELNLADNANQVFVPTHGCIALVQRYQLACNGFLWSAVS